MPIVLAEAPAKVILAGEHFVVKGEPALAAAIGLRARVLVEPAGSGIMIESATLGAALKVSEDLSTVQGDPRLRPLVEILRALAETSELRPARVRIESSIPVGAGLGSSASTAVAFAAAYSRYLGLELEREEISRLAYQAEVVVHGKPSGIDNTIATYGGVIIYRRGAGFERVRPRGLEGYRIIVADTGIERNTGEVVRRVLALYDRHPEVLGKVYEAARELVLSMRRALEEGRIEEVGELMNICQGLLTAIGVSNLAIERIVRRALEAGALGAKLTGAGCGGSVIVLCRREEAARVVDAIRPVSRAVYPAEFDEAGVTIKEG